MMPRERIVRDQICSGRPTRYAETTTAVMGSMSNSTVSGCTMTAVALVTSDVMVLVKLDVDEINGMLTSAGGCVFEGVNTIMYA